MKIHYRGKRVISPITLKNVCHITVVSALLFLAACNSSETTSETTTDSTETTETIVTDADFEATDWTDASHSKEVDPNFDEVFTDTEVKRLDFVITAARWQSMLDNMEDIYGAFGTNTNTGGGAQGGSPAGGPPATGAAQGRVTQINAGATTANATLIDTDEDPIFVPAEVYYNGKQWYRVGLRFKGNSSLQTSWEAGILKLSFKMDFDEYEDDYPQIKNQRFYGFKKFSLKNNYDDDALMREKIAADVYKQAGMAVSHTAFYTLYIDHGNGPEYFGLYTLVEEVDGSVLDTQFSNDEGNLYKPEDGSANFVEGTFSTDNFEKKTNEEEADWSDITNLFTALHAETATTDPATWRENLEAVFDVDGFLRYLAITGIIQNWDTYGRMPHNFYLYNNPATGKLTWIPWDNNEALQDGKQGGSLALDFSNLSTAEWPLIAKIYADETYKARYDALLTEIITGPFETSTMQAAYETYSTLIAPYATTEVSGYSFLNSSADFYTAIETLKSHAASRAAAVSTYLTNP